MKRLLIAGLIALCSIQTSLAQTRLNEIYGNATGDRFGFGLACRGNALLIGAPNEDSGVVRLYLPASAQPPRTLPLPFVNIIGGEEFGSVVAIIDDVSGDGVRDYMVGMSGEGDLTGMFAPYVFIYADPGSGPFSAPIATFDGFGIPGFGEAISNLGDITGDGRAEVIIATPARFSGNGEIAVFETVNQTAIYTITGITGSRLGRAVVRFNDMPSDADAFPDFAASSPDYFDQGRVSLYSGLDGTVMATISNDEFNLDFGRKLANVGDVTGDGIEDLLIGAPIRDDFGGLGMAFLYSGASLNSLSLLKSDALCAITGASSSFASAVAGIGDVNGDSRNEFAISDPSFGDDGEGIMRIYQFNGSGCVEVSSVTGALVNDSLGIRAAGVAAMSANNSCDFNADGAPDFAATTRSEVNGEEAGSVVLFAGTAPTPTPTPTPTATPQQNLPRRSDLQVKVTKDGNFSAFVQFDENTRGLGCTTTIDARIERDGQISDRVMIANLKPEGSSIRVLADRLPQVILQNCIRPAAHFRAETNCSAGTSLISNVAATFVNCGASGSVTPTQWVQAIARKARIDLTVSGKAKLKKLPAKIRALKFKKMNGKKNPATLSCRKRR